MTVEEMDEVIQEYCGKDDDCGDCEVHDLCCKIDGMFDHHPAICKEAYEIITKRNKEQPDNVNHPKHYETGKFECIDVMVETQGKIAVQSYCICAAFKYLYRHMRKNGLEDIKKARWYLDKFIELEEGEADDR